MKAGEIIKKARKSKRLSQSELAGQVGVSIQAVSQWENGITRPNVFSAKRLAIALDLERDWLLDDDAVEAIGGRLPRSRYATEYKGLVPLIDINEATYFSRNMNFSKSIIPKAQLLLRPTYPASSYCFAIKVKDEKHKSIFLPGDILIVNTNVFPEDNDYVVSQVREMPVENSVLGRFVFNGDDPFAWILNDDDEALWSVGLVGTVIEHRRLRTPGSDPGFEDMGLMFMSRPNRGPIK